MGLDDAGQLPPSPVLHQTPFLQGPLEKNNQFFSAAGPAISLYNLPWLSLTLRMRSLKEDAMKETSGRGAVNHLRLERTPDSWDPWQLFVRDK